MLSIPASPPTPAYAQGMLNPAEFFVTPGELRPGPVLPLCHCKDSIIRYTLAGECAKSLDSGL